MLEERQVRTLPEALRESPGVSVQKTAHGQGSPKIRGLNGFHTLLLVDGIRINNSTWRSGNVEYWNTVDPYSLDRFELIRGAGSVLYGTDAVTGMGQAFTQGPDRFGEGLWNRDQRSVPLCLGRAVVHGPPQHDGRVRQLRLALRRELP